MYIDCYYNRSSESEMISVVERVKGERVFKEYKADYHYYITDPGGEHVSMTGMRVKKIAPRSYGERKKMLAMKSDNVVTWESDVDPILRCLEQNYNGKGSPDLHVAFFDIETDYDPIYGWSDPKDARNRINAISVHLQWLDQMVCLAIPPRHMSMEEAQKLADKVGEVILFQSEAEMLQTFMKLVEDADVLSGWNSEFFDIPYVINRIHILMGKHGAAPLCLWGLNPKVREYDRNGKTERTYELIGRIHVDYLDIYKKFNTAVLDSYKLNSVAEFELGETKVDYDGTLDDLYNDDFELFLRYNIQDTRLLDKLDKKKRYMSLINSAAHTNCVLIPNVLGTVTQIDQAIILQAHSMGVVVKDKVKREKDRPEDKSAGGWVAIPKLGLHKYPASEDLNSLYPSTIRACNISSETVIGQIRLDRTNKEIADYLTRGPKFSFAGWWNDRFLPEEVQAVIDRDKGYIINLDMEGGETFELSGYEVYDLLFNSGQPWHMSANGTIFTHEKQGIIPAMLTRWYSERKESKKKMQYLDRVIAGKDIPDRFTKG